MLRALRVFSVVVAFSALAAPVACSSTTNATADGGADAGVDPALKQAVAERYADIVRDSYAASIAGAEAMKTAIAAFVAAPSQATLDAARKAWVDARPTYVETEPYRFYDGPIDGPPDNLEARINGWPLDEAFIDYTKDDANAGIINNATLFPTIDAGVVRDNNEKGGEKNLSAGWHAVEFLLWGQDVSTAGPGNRPYTDFVTGAGATAKNQDRRRAYLTAATEVLLEDMHTVAEQWDETKADSYGATFTKDVDAALKNAFQGIGYLAAVELPKERIFNAFQSQDQEEEHSCFSDTTPQDLVADGVGIENVYLGRYGGKTGPGLDSLVKATNPDLDARIKSGITAAIDATRAIPVPFDQAILTGAGTETGSKVEASIKAWEDVSKLVLQAAAGLGYRINIE